MIATYALCGCANFAAMGIIIGSITAMNPVKGPSVSRVAFTGMLGGIGACFMTACVAGAPFRVLQITSYSKINVAVRENYFYEIGITN